MQKKVGSEAYSGSVVKMGENHAIVTKIGKETFIGKAVGLVSEDKGMVQLLSCCDAHKLRATFKRFSTKSVISVS